MLNFLLGVVIGIELVTLLIDFLESYDEKHKEDF